LRSEIKFSGAVAFFDILGFKDHFETSSNATELLDLEAIRDKVIGELIISSQYSYRIVQRDFDQFNHFSGIKHSVRLGQLYFSDSLVLYLPLGQDLPFSSPNTIIESMAYTCSLLIARSIWANIPLRGAISYGECIVSHDPVYVLGKPLIEAYELQERQLWAGAALTNSALQYYSASKDNLVVDYEVPCREGEKERLSVVNWPANSMGPSVRTFVKGSEDTEGPAPDWDVCFACKSKDESVRDKVREKKENTIEFFLAQDICPKNVMFGPEQRTHSIDWRELYLESR